MKAWITGLFFLLAAPASLAEPELLVSNAWVREAPPGAHMLAAYLTIENPSAQVRVLTGVESKQFSHVMLHKSEVVDGMARMIHVDRLELPAHGKIVLEPGSYHLMMPAPEKRLTTGDQVDFVLSFANGESMNIQAEVRKP